MQIPENAGQRLGLRESTGKSIEDESLCCTRRSENLAHQSNHHIIRHELARIHDCLGSFAQFRSLCSRTPQQVARGDVGNVEFLSKDLRLRSLPDTGRTKQNDSHGGFPPD
jgi:hypothetical protein